MTTTCFKINKKMHQNGIDYVEHSMAKRRFFKTKFFKHLLTSSAIVGQSSSILGHWTNICFAAYSLQLRPPFVVLASKDYRFIKTAVCSFILWPFYFVYGVLRWKDICYNVINFWWYSYELFSNVLLFDVGKINTKMVKILLKVWTYSSISNDQYKNHLTANHNHYKLPNDKKCSNHFE